jgi:diaminopimelate decarboxylase
MARTLKPQDWGLQKEAGGALLVGGFRTVDLAREFGTPLHVLNEARLEETANRFRRSMEAAYPGRTSVHYAFKCNSVPAVVATVRRAGLKAEVMSEFELELALRMGYSGEEIIVNGPGKTDRFLLLCLRANVRLVIVDSLSELQALGSIAGDQNRDVDILFRINPDFVPRGLNSGTATASRKGCAFGLDLKAGEPQAALAALKDMNRVRFRGYHFHIGTGIRDPKEYSRAVERLAPLIRDTRAAGRRVEVVDVGGGFASMTTRELTTREFLVYQAFERLPSGLPRGNDAAFEDFACVISDALLRIFPAGELPELIAEPGRSIASPNQFLLLTVHRVKERPGVRKWLVTDGGLGTVTLPTFYEYHEVFLADKVTRPRTERVTIIGSVCFASDIVYRNKWMPSVRPGEVLAIMDSGAYFTAQESSFGFARPAVVAVSGNGCRLVRRRESFEDMVSRDVIERLSYIKEEENEILRHQARLKPIAGPAR